MICQRSPNIINKYILNSYLYFQNIHIKEFGISDRKAKQMIYILNSIFETGFKPNGMFLFSESTSDIHSENSFIDPNSRSNVNVAFENYKQKVSEIKAISNICI